MIVQILMLVYLSHSFGSEVAAWKSLGMFPCKGVTKYHFNIPFKVFSANVLSKPAYLLPPKFEFWSKKTF